MSLVINHNMMAANTARNLNSHYKELSVSTQRLSSGLRINSAADDAAGLAIRELQRADISTLQQGARNANDAVSMIQTADGALGIIDEKLTRMKELAEQAATGTYDSTQRLMIESEYQAMASEITRIANATDFNGIHLLNGNLSSSIHNGSGSTSTGKMKVHFGTGNDSAEDYYYIQIGSCTAESFSIGNDSTFVNTLDSATQIFSDSILSNFESFKNGTTEQQNIYNDIIPRWITSFKQQMSEKSLPTTDAELTHILELWTPTAAQQAAGLFFNDEGKATDYTLPELPTTINEFNSLSDSNKEKLRYAFGNAAMYNFTNVSPFRGATAGNAAYGMESNVCIFGYNAAYALDPAYQTDIATAENILKKSLDTTNGYFETHDYGGYSVATQEDAQLALKAIDNAIVEKDKIRAHLGAMQNRLENTITNLNVQAENLQAAESRISDVDVSTEMTNFVREQILSQSAVAMLAQANSLPQMAMKLIGG